MPAKQRPGRNADSCPALLGSFRYLAAQDRFQPIPLLLEQGRIHLPNVIGDCRHKVHVGDDVSVDVDTRGHLDDRHHAVAQFHDAALGHVEDFLVRTRVGARIGDLLHLVDELVGGALLDDLELAVRDLLLGLGPRRQRWRRTG